MDIQRHYLHQIAIQNHIMDLKSIEDINNASMGNEGRRNRDEKNERERERKMKIRKMLIEEKLEAHRPEIRKMTRWLFLTFLSSFRT